MENNNKQQTNTQHEKSQTEIGLPEKQPIERSKFILVWLALIIVFGLIAGTYWFLQQQFHAQQLELVGLTQNAALTKQLEQGVTQLKQAMDVDRSAIEQRVAELSTANSNLIDKVDSLAKAQTLTNDDVIRSWTLAEIKFLLQSANQSTLLAGDITKAQAALSMADQRLKVLADPRLHALRSLISDERLALDSVAKVDVDGLSVQLQSALNKIDDLQVLMGPQLGSKTDKNATIDSSISSSWKMALLNAWQEIKSLVVIRHQQDAAIAVLVPEQRYFLYQNLRLKLESAKLGLLSARETVFHDNLASAEQWLQQYFIGTERDAMIVILKTMQSETIAIEMPDISASLIWLQHYGDQ